MMTKRVNYIFLRLKSGKEKKYICLKLFCLETHLLLS